MIAPGAIWAQRNFKASRVQDPMQGQTASPSPPLKAREEHLVIIQLNMTRTVNKKL